MRAQRILYLQYANPASYPPLVHGSHILAEHGASIRMIGTQPTVGAGIAMPPHPAIALTLLREGRGIRQKLAFGAFILRSLVSAARSRPDWLYVSDALAAPAGLLARFVSRAGVVYHEHDVHTEATPSVFMRVCLAARRGLARAAAIRVVPNAGRAEALQAAAGVADVQVVFNCPRLADLRIPTAAEGGPVRLVYFGTVVPQRLPLALATAIGQLRGAVTLDIIGYEPIGAEGHVARLLEHVAHHGAPDSIAYTGLLPDRADVLDRLTKYHLGIAFVPENGGDLNMRTMAGASNKAFDYLACGVPILVSEVPDWHELFVRPGYARSADSGDPDSIAAALRWAIDHRAELRAMGRCGQRRVEEEWHYERQFAPVAERVLVSRHSRGSATLLAEAE